MIDLVIGNLALMLTVAGLVLVLLETMVPGAHFIVLGMALLGAGLVGMVLGPFAPITPAVLAVLVVLFGAAATYVYREFDFYGGKNVAQTKDSSSLAGRTGYVTDTVTTQGGRVKVKNGGFNPFYSARTMSGTIPEGEEVIVVDPGGGNVLTVEALGAVGEDDIDRELARGTSDRRSDESDVEREESA